MGRNLSSGIIFSTLLFFCFNNVGITQSLNGFRARQNINWNVPGNWDRFISTSRGIATYYYGNGLTNMVLVLHNVILTVNVNINIPKLEILS